jgi:predicted metal-binding protein
LLHPVATCLRGAVRVSCALHTDTFETAPPAGPTIYVCITCRPTGEPVTDSCLGVQLANATAEAAQGTAVEVRKVKCLANCSRGPSAAVRCNGSWTYIFGNLDVGCGADLVTGATLLASASDGLMPWRGRPEPLKRGLIARVPPVSFEGDPA